MPQCVMPQCSIKWIGLHWIALDWIGLDWIGLDWIGLDRIETKRDQVRIEISKFTPTHPSDNLTMMNFHFLLVDDGFSKQEKNQQIMAYHVWI